MRDADVMIATLGDSWSATAAARRAGPLRQALEAHRIRTSAGARSRPPKTAVERLTEARARVAGWPVDSDGFGAFEDGLQRIYRQGRRDGARHASGPAPSGSTSGESAPRTSGTTSLLLEAAWPPVMSTLADEAHELSDRLGDDHDLAVLLAWAHEHARPDGRDPIRAGRRDVESRREELQADAFAYGARLYADKPGVFVERLERWWTASERTQAVTPHPVP